jgi:galactose mutarotase-like enzyme
MGLRMYSYCYYVKHVLTKQRNFTVVAHTADSITFSIVDPDGKEGFPGEVVSYITYTMTKNTWNFKMVALSTTKKTPIMLSSHVSVYPNHVWGRS